MFSLIKSKAQEAPKAQVAVPTPSFIEKLAEMSLKGRVWMWIYPADKWDKARIRFDLDIETPGIGKLELKSDTIRFEGEPPINEALDNLYHKYLMIKSIQF